MSKTCFRKYGGIESMEEPDALTDTLFTCMHLADAFIQSDLQCIQVIHLFVSMCVPRESNPQPLHC